MGPFLIDGRCGRVQITVGGANPGQGGPEGACHGKQASKQNSSVASASVSVSRAIRSYPDFPSRCGLSVVSQNKPFLLQDVFGHGVYHRKRKHTRRLSQERLK